MSIIKNSLIGFRENNNGREITMKVNVYSLYNNKAKAYMPPLIGLPDLDDDHNEIMFRIGEYLSALATADNVLPAEYDLFYIGKFDRLTGKYEDLEDRQHLVNCLELLGVSNPEMECELCKEKVYYLIDVEESYSEIILATFPDAPKRNKRLCRGCYVSLVDKSFVTIVNDEDSSVEDLEGDLELEREVRK